jgi:hypothetical protein
MSDREFSEVDLRAMLEKATGFRKDSIEGRWLIKARHRGRPWEVVVEPDFEMQRLVVITAYAVG